MLYIYIFSIFNLFQSMVYLIHFSKSFREEETDQTIIHKAVVREGREREIKSRKKLIVCFMSFKVFFTQPFLFYL